MIKQVLNISTPLHNEYRGFLFLSFKLKKKIGRRLKSFRHDSEEEMITIEDNEIKTSDARFCKLWLPLVAIAETEQ
jgi:hypothetical protein